MLSALIQSTGYYKNLEAEISRSATEACDHLMNEMGAEIHDDLVQKLSTMQLYLERLDTFASLDPELESLLITMRSEYDHICRSVKRISRQLMPVNMEEEALSVSIETLCKNMENPRSSTIQFNQVGFERPVAKMHHVNVYRVVQELLHNALKHSFAWHMWVTLTWESNALIIDVEDDGTGVNNLTEVVTRFRQKRNTLKMRTDTMKASINYLKGNKGLLAKIEAPISSICNDTSS
ncbi:ATP-binding protein [Chryseolinea sp. T2]|uniref:sensor histidine kinase n=1 Tax=Chryseolinea sp. T2 TaxID=3129255 RepID=UPI003078A473